MIMAAGLGTRLQPFTSIFPKPLAPVMGVPSIQYAFDLLNTTRVDDTIVNVHYKADSFMQQVRFLQSAAKLHFSDESSMLLGSGGGLRKAKPFFQGKPFYLLNADTVCSIPIRDVELVHAKLRHQYGVEITMVIFAKSPPGADYREILFDPKKRVVTSLGEKKQNCPFYSGISIIHPEVIPDHLPEDAPSDFVDDILLPAIRRGKVGAYFFDNSLDSGQRNWFDLGSPELWAETHFRWLEMLEEDELPTLWNQRVRAKSHRISSQLWTNTPMASFDPRAHDWAGPAYWGTLPTSFEPPKKLGRHQILYGSSPPEFNSENGIGYLGVWKSL